MPDIVGTAYVRIRGVTTGLAGDIQDGLKKGMAGTDTDVLERNVSDAAKRAGESGGEEGGKSLARSMRENFKKNWDKDNKKGKGIFKVLDGIKSFKLPSQAWMGILGIPALGGVIQLASSYVLTLVGQLGFVVQAAAGAGVALGGMFAAVGLAAIPLVLAFKAQTEEMENFKESVEGQKELWMEVGGAVQATFLPALDQAIVNMGDLRDEFTVFGQEVGTIFGEFVLGLSEFLTSTESTGRWVEIFEGASVVFEFLLDAVQSLVRALLPFLQAAMPIAVQFADAIRRAAANFAFFIETSQESGALGTTFQDWWDKATQIGRSIWNIVEALWEVFSVAADVVAPQFDTLESKTQGWVDFLRSAEGQSTLKQIFEDALPVAQEVNALLGDLVDIFREAFVEEQGTGDMVEFIRSIRTDWLPALESLLTTFSSGLGDGLRELAEAFGTLIQEAAESGALGTFTDVLIVLIEALTDVIQLPGVGQIIGALAAAVGILGLLGNVIGPLIGLITTLGGVIQLFMVSTAPAWAGLALAAGIIAAVVAAVAIAILIWKNWDKITAWLAQAWEAIQNFFSDIWDAVTGFFAGIPEWIEGVWTSILEFIASIPEALLAAATALWQWIVDAVPIVLGKMAYFAGSVIGFLLSLPVRILQLMIKASQALWTWVRDAVPEALKWLGNMWLTIYTWIGQTIARLITEGVKMLRALVQWIVDAVKEAPGKLADFAQSVWDWAKTFIEELPSKFIGWISGWAAFGTELVGNIVDGLNSAIRSVWSWGKNLLQAIVDGILAHAGPLAGVLGGLFRSLGFSTGNTGSGGPTTPRPPGGGTFSATALSTMSSPFAATASAFVPSPINTQAFANVPTSQGGAINLLVKIGDQDITRLVDARVSDNDQALANALNVRRR